MNQCFARTYPDIFCIYIDTCRLQIAIKRECLIHFISHMQPHILRQSSIIRIKITVAPLIFHSRRTLGIIPVIIYTGCNHIFARLNIRSQIESESHHSVFMLTDKFSVHIQVNSLACTFKLNKDFTPFCTFGKPEMLAVPYNGICQVFDIYLKCLILIKSMGKRHFLPIRIIETYSFSTRNITYFQTPVTVKIIFFPLICLDTCHKSNQQNTYNKTPKHHTLFIKLIIALK